MKVMYDNTRPAGVGSIMSVAGWEDVTQSVPIKVGIYSLAIYGLVTLLTKFGK